MQTQPHETEITRENVQSDFYTFEILRIQVGPVHLQVRFSPPWTEIDAEAQRQANLDRTTDYNGTLPYWHHRARLLRDARAAKRAVLLRAAQAVWRELEEGSG